MKRIILLVILICILLTLTGCIEYGTGFSYGYITTQEDGLFSNNLWFRADLSSSNTDCYTLEPSLKELANQYAQSKERVKIIYKRELWRWTGCSSETIIQIIPI